MRSMEFGAMCPSSVAFHQEMKHGKIMPKIPLPSEEYFYLLMSLNHQMRTPYSAQRRYASVRTPWKSRTMNMVESVVTPGTMPNSVARAVVCWYARRYRWNLVLLAAVYTLLVSDK